DVRMLFTNSITTTVTNRALARSDVAEIFPLSDSAVVAFAVLADNDRDGMADDWEVAFFGSTSNPRGGASDDFDSDGLTNLQEFQNGTDPTDESNALRITSATLN